MEAPPRRLPSRHRAIAPSRHRAEGRPIFGILMQILVGFAR